MLMVDTSILVDILRKNAHIFEIFDRNKSISLFTSEISVMELFYGIHSLKLYQEKPKLKVARISQINSLLHNFIILPFNRKAALKTAEIMGKLKIKGQMIDFRDGMIAGTSLANGINYVFTRNIDHFKRIPEVQIWE